jgi:hypothetical protein
MRAETLGPLVRRVCWEFHYGEDFFGYSAKEILGYPLLGTLTPASGFEDRDLASFLDGLRREPNRYAFSVNVTIVCCCIGQLG